MRTALRALKSVTAIVICSLNVLERGWLCISRRYPSTRVVRSLSLAISTAMTGRNDRYRTVLLATGARIILDPADLLRDVYFFGTYEPEITDLIVRNLRPGGVAFDVGANAGYYTLLMAGIVGDSGQVHSFEPNPKLGAILEDSVLMNSYGKRVFVNRVAVGASIEHELDFFVSQLPDNSGISSLRPHKWGLENNGYSKEKILVDTITLDEYIGRHKIQRCDVVKIDVEGTEDDVVRGMGTVLRRLRPQLIICETSACGIADALLRQSGYRRSVVTASGLSEVSDEAFWGNLVYVA